jgi:hypothetical protein
LESCSAVLARGEAQLMVAEKLAAVLEASETLFKGGSFFVVVVDQYREHVTANATRLTR